MHATQRTYAHTRTCEQEQLNVYEQVGRGLDHHKHEEEDHEIQEVREEPPVRGGLDVPGTMLELENLARFPPLDNHGPAVKRLLLAVVPVCA